MSGWEGIRVNLYCEKCEAVIPEQCLCDLVVTDTYKPEPWRERVIQFIFTTFRFITFSIPYLFYWRLHHYAANRLHRGDSLSFSPKIRSMENISLTLFSFTRVIYWAERIWPDEERYEHLYDRIEELEIMYETLKIE